MPLSALTISPNLIHSHIPKPSSYCSCSSSSSSSSSNETHNNAKVITGVKTSKRSIFNVGIGLLAASVVALSPLEDANATRIEYYATVGEPLCEMKFAPSGLGFSSVVALSPLEDANATRIEYYATVGEPLCEMKFAPSGLGFCDLDVTVTRKFQKEVHYTARFGDGTVFDSSYKRARPLTMRIGVGKVIKGLDQGIYGGEGVPPMLVGGKRKLHIPSHLAYGPEPAGCFGGDCNIPGNAILDYDIDFVGIYSGNRSLPASLLGKQILSSKCHEVKLKLRQDSKYSSHIRAPSLTIGLQIVEKDYNYEESFSL